MSNLSDIMFEDIIDGYGYGMYGDFKIIMMKKNSYVNASKLCKKYDKEYKFWSRNENSNELINIVRKRIQQKNLMVQKDTINKIDDICDEIHPIIIIKGGGDINKISGTYIHPLLIPHVASWISPEFGIRVSEIVNEYLNAECKNKLLKKEQELNEKKQELDEKKQKNLTLINKVDILLKKMDEQTKQLTEQNMEIIEQNKKMTMETKVLKKQNNKQIKKLSELQIIVGKISNKLDSCAHMPNDNELSDRFVVMKSDIDYYVIRAQERNIYNAIKRQEDKGYKKINDLIESESIPNSIYLWNTIKDELIKEKKIKTFRNSFTLEIPEQDFVTIVKSIFDQRKHYN